MSTEIENLIKENNGECTYFDHELIGAYFTVQNLEHLIKQCETGLRQQLAVKDLEVMQLRGALYQASRQLDLVQPNSIICKIVSDALSTTFTPDYLREWLGEPVAEVVSEKFADFMQPTATLKWIQTEHDVGTKLYAPKLDIK